MKRIILLAALLAIALPLYAQEDDSYDFTIIQGYSVPKEDVSILSAPGTGECVFVLKKGRTYEFVIGHPKNGWWRLAEGILFSGEEQIDLPGDCWIPVSAVCMHVINPYKKETLAVRKALGEDAPVVGSVTVGMVVHPMEVTEAGDWIRMVVDGQPDLTGWVESSCLCWLANGDCMWH